MEALNRWNGGGEFYELVRFWILAFADLFSSSLS